MPNIISCIYQQLKNGIVHNNLGGWKIGKNYCGLVLIKDFESPCVVQSVVLISKLPMIALFNHMVSIIAPEYFDNGEPCLEAGKSAHMV